MVQKVTLIAILVTQTNAQIATLGILSVLLMEDVLAAEEATTPAEDQQPRVPHALQALIPQPPLLHAPHVQEDHILLPELPAAALVLLVNTQLQLLEQLAVLLVQLGRMLHQRSLLLLNVQAVLQVNIPQQGPVLVGRALRVSIRLLVRELASIVSQERIVARQGKDLVLIVLEERILAQRQLHV